MNTIIYNDRYSELTEYAIGHIDANGVVYNHRHNEYASCVVGHISKNGVIYNHKYDETPSYAVGHVDSEGKVYNHRYDEYASCRVGHVNSKGEIYSDYSAEYSEYAVGHVSPANIKSAAAAYLLMFYNGEMNTTYTATSVLKDNEHSTNKNDFAKETAGKTKNGCFTDLLGTNIGIFFVIAIILTIGNVFEKHPLMAFMIIGLFVSLFIIAKMKASKERNADDNEPVHMKKSTEFVKPKTSVKNTKETSKRNVAGSGAIIKKTNTPEKPMHKVEKNPIKENEVSPRYIVTGCPGCGVKCRVPAGYGSIKIKCPKCGGEIIVKT